VIRAPFSIMLTPYLFIKNMYLQLLISI